MKLPALFAAASLALIASAFPQEETLLTKQEVAPMMQEVAPGIFQLGKMRLDKNAGSLTVPGKVNMVKGALEYLLCTPKGPTHESLLTADVQPSDLHFGMLLLGAKGAGLTTPGPGDAPPPQLNAEYLARAPKLKGDPVLLTAKWKDAAGKEKSAAVEDWVLNKATNKTAVRGPWIYTGSMFYENQFLAQQDGVMGSVITNPAALINNPRKGADNDQIWEVSERNIPPLDTALELTITIQPTAETKSP